MVMQVVTAKDHLSGQVSGSIGDIFIEVTNQTQRMERTEKGIEQALTDSLFPQVLIYMCCPYLNDCVASIAHD
jgi:hypothetical protein